MTNKITCFEDLTIWQNAQDIAVKIYKLVEENDFIKKDFSLKDQFKSAALSISDNIAEGFEYNNNPDFYRVLRISKGSCGEIRNKIYFARRLEFINETTYTKLQEEKSGDETYYKGILSSLRRMLVSCEEGLEACPGALTSAAVSSLQADAGSFVVQG